jgi:hypothetical protein
MYTPLVYFPPFSGATEEVEIERRGETRYDDQGGILTRDERMNATKVQPFIILRLVGE